MSSRRQGRRGLDAKPDKMSGIGWLAEDRKMGGWRPGQPNQAERPKNAAIWVVKWLRDTLNLAGRERPKGTRALAHLFAFSAGARETRRPK